MPDISKLPELCKILNISFEELVGEESQEVEITKRLMENEDAAVTLEEMAQVGQLVTPEKIDEKVNETIKTEGKIPFSVLVSMAPFVDRETLGKAAEEVADIDIGKVCAIAPFLSKKALDKIVEKSLKNGNVNIGNITALAPFLSRKAMSSVVECCLANGQADKLTAIAPFMGRDTSIFLDYMDEDDVEKLAFMALNAGKDIEAYLDYMDEDAIKRLLLQSVRK